MAKGHGFTLEQKQEIIQYRETVLASGGKIINRALTTWTNAHFQVNVSEMNIRRIVKQKKDFSGLDVGTSVIPSAYKSLNAQKWRKPLKIGL